MALKMPSLSPAVADLGLGDLLTQQVGQETDEMRKKRMKEMADRQMGMGSPATMMLFGAAGGA